MIFSNQSEFLRIEKIIGLVRPVYIKAQGRYAGDEGSITRKMILTDTEATFPCTVGAQTYPVGTPYPRCVAFFFSVTGSGNFKNLL